MKNKKMVMLKKYVVAVVFMMSSQFVFAQQPDTLSLSEAINKALDQNSLIKVAKNEWSCNLITSWL